jgi:hypothetical protein
MKKTSIILVLLSMSVWLAGCGTSEYERRLSSAASKGGSGSRYADFGDEINIAGTKLSLRLPKAMQSADITDAVHGKFPLFELQGHKATYEGFVEDSEKNKVHYYLYVIASDPLPMSPARDWLDTLKQKITAGADCSAEVNKNYQVPTPEGSSKTFEEMHYKCAQKFFCPKPNDPKNVLSTDGTLAGVSILENGQAVGLLLRYPSYLAGHPSPSFNADWIKLISGTVKVAAPGG